MSTPETQPKSKQIQPENFPERLVWYAMTGTYIWFLLGAT